MDTYDVTIVGAGPGGLACAIKAKEDELVGRNDSDENNFVEGDGWDNFFRLRFKYLLPIGAGRDEIIATYKIKIPIIVTRRSWKAWMKNLNSGSGHLVS